MLPKNLACEGCGKPITLWPTVEYDGSVKWRAYDRPIARPEYTHDCPKWRALQAQRSQHERRILPTERQHARRYEQPTRRSTPEWPEEKRSTTLSKRHKTQLKTLAVGFVVTLGWALIHWLRHYFE
jgi:hypothetical protein